MTEDDIYVHIDKVIPALEEIKAVLVLKRLNSKRLDSFYGDWELEELLDNSVKILYDAQDGRIPF